MCIQHDPERREAARAVRAAGGQAAGVAKRLAKAALPEGVPGPPKTLEDAVRWSSWAMRAIATGEIDARTGHEVGYLIARFTEALQKRDLLAEIAKLRADLAEARKATARPRVA